MRRPGLIFVASTFAAAIVVYLIALATFTNPFVWTVEHPTYALSALLPVLPIAIVARLALRGGRPTPVITDDDQADSTSDSTGERAVENAGVDEVVETRDAREIVEVEPRTSEPAGVEPMAFDYLLAGPVEPPEAPAVEPEPSRAPESGAVTPPPAAATTPLRVPTAVRMLPAPGVALEFPLPGATTPAANTSPTGAAATEVPADSETTEDSGERPAAPPEKFDSVEDLAVASVLERGKSVAEVSRTLKVRPATVQMWVARARKRS